MKFYTWCNSKDHHNLIRLSDSANMNGIAIGPLVKEEILTKVVDLTEKIFGCMKKYVNFQMMKLWYVLMLLM